MEAIAQWRPGQRKVPRAAPCAVVKGLFVIGNYSNKHATGQAGKLIFGPESIPYVLRLSPMASLPGGCAPMVPSQVGHCAPFGQEALGITLVCHPGPLREELLAEGTKAATCKKRVSCAHSPTATPLHTHLCPWASTW